MIKPFLSAFSLRAFGAFSALLLNLVITNVAAANDAGLFFVIFAIIATTSTLARLGFDNAIVKAVAINSSSASADYTRAVVRYCLTVTIAVASVIAALNIGLADQIAKFVFNKPELANPLTIGAIAAIFQAVIFVYASAFHGKERINESIILKNVIAPALCALILALAYFGPGRGSPNATTLTLVYGFALFLSLLAMFAMAKRILPPPVQSRKLPKQLKISLQSSARIFFVSSSMEASTLWAATLICAAYLAANEVAYYASAQRASMAAVFILMAVNAVTAPRFAALHAKGDREKLQKLAQQSTTLTGLVAFPICLFGSIFSAEIMALFGETFTAAASAFSILIVAQFINGVVGPANQLLMMTGHEHIHRNVTLIGGAANIVLCVLLVPFYGILGAAWVLAAVVAFQSILKVVVVRKYLGFWILRPRYHTA
jgi:O-antigen/teichoic acid export membrane protein